jgi:hypothetical protein
MAKKISDRHRPEESENIKSARNIAKDSDQIFALKLWLKRFDDGDKPTEQDIHQNKLWAIENALDAGSRLFREHNIELPQAWRALRLDLYEAARGRSANYFQSKGGPQISMPMMVLQSNAAAAVDFLKQAGEGDLETCYKLVHSLLKKHGLDIKKITKRDPAYLAIGDWRKSIKSRKQETPTAYFLRVMYDGQILWGAGKDRSKLELKNNAEYLIQKAAAHFPDLIKKV